MIRQTSRWAVASEQDKSPMISVLHANYAVGYLQALQDIASEKEINKYLDFGGTKLFGQSIIPGYKYSKLGKAVTSNNIADTLLNNWVWQNWKFKAFTKDCNKLDYKSIDFGPPPSLIINTSCEHITQEQYDSWLDNLPDDSLIVLQSNNYKIDEHIRIANSLQDFKNQCKINTIFQGKLDLPLYTRYMLIGKK